MALNKRDIEHVIERLSGGTVPERGLEALAAYIKQKGLKPGIWTNATFSQTEYAEQHKDWFVMDGAGNVARGNWINHPVDASVPAALDTLVRKTANYWREREEQVTCEQPSAIGSPSPG